MGASIPKTQHRTRNIAKPQTPHQATWIETMETKTLFRQTMGIWKVKTPERENINLQQEDRDKQWRKIREALEKMAQSAWAEQKSAKETP